MSRRNSGIERRVIEISHGSGRVGTPAAVSARATVHHPLTSASTTAAPASANACAVASPMPAAAIAGDGHSFPVSTPLADEISKTLKRRGFRFVGPTIVYASMQAVGLVNDHSSRCFRRMRVAPEDLGRHRR